MTGTSLIGEVGAHYLAARLSQEDGEGTARFIIDCLTADQAGAIGRAILDEPELAELIELKLPAHFMEGQGLPDSVLTNERATYFRNASCEKPARLVANTGDDEQQSLKELVPIGEPQLMAHPELWVRVASAGLELSDEHLRWWERALNGLQDLHFVSIERFAEYVIQTRQAIANDGHPIQQALGHALPVLRLPRDTCYFNALNEKHRSHTSRWRTLYAAAHRKRACFLSKQTTNQLTLNQDDLARAFEKVKESIPEEAHPAVEAFIETPSGWNPGAVQLANCEWEAVKPLFDGLRREKYNLGQATLDFYLEREAELLGDSERSYLERLIARKTTEPEEEDEQFYESHRNELKEDRKLKSAWDRFVFGSPRETNDFIAGLALSMEALFSNEASANHRHLRIRCDHRTIKDLRELNVDAGMFFVSRYAGLDVLMGQGVTWDVGELFNFPAHLKTWREKGKINNSVAKAALQIKFILELEVELSGGGTESYSTQLIWKYNPGQVLSEFSDDWGRLTGHPLVYCSTNREATSSKGRYQSVDLTNVKTLAAAFGQDRGSFVGAYKRACDIGQVWKANLSEAASQHLITSEQATKLLQLFETFKTTYSDAICGFRENGLAHASLIPQAEAYGRLLDALCREAKGDRNRELLLRPLLNIGTVAVHGGCTTSIVAPWHPLRMAAIARKATMVSEMVRYLLKAARVYFGDTRLFFVDLEKELRHPFYPEIVLGWDGNKPELLALTDTVLDYSLHEVPLVDDRDPGGTNDSPVEGSKRVLDLVNRYIKLHPHEQANLSVVLYNCDSARLPQAVVDKIGELHEDDDEVRCQVVLRHRDARSLRALYERIVEGAGTDADSYNASEATRDFMARLRIGIMADQAPVPNPQDGCPTDIVFSQDVIARHARVEWYPETAKPVALNDLVPARWSRRRPAAHDDMKSVVYLCCPVQSQEGWAFVTALTSFLRSDWDGDVRKRLLPGRQLDFQDPSMARIFEETHNLGNWVVNYDELLDRRQLMNQGVRVIRYKQSSTQGRNLVVSSKAPLGLLKSMVLSRIRSLDLGLSDEENTVLSDRFIRDANDISGDIVLRAAKRGRSASELMGIVLSRFLIRQELGNSRYFGWYFLDDYADWLGQREQQIADILALSPEITDEGQLRIAVVISEAKYIDAGGLSVKRKESQKQLRDTVKRIHEAVFGDPDRLDRNLWLARLSDLILDGVQVPASAGYNLADWRRAIREGACEIYVRGYSHVFVSGPADSPDCSDFSQVPDLEDSYQEVFGWGKLRELVLCYFRGDDPEPIRLQNSHENAGEDTWEIKHFRRPGERISPTPQKTSSVAGPEIDTIPQTRGGHGPQDADTDEREWKPEGTLRIDTDDLDNVRNNVFPDTTIKSVPWAYPAIAAIIAQGSQTADTTEADQRWLKEIEQRTRGALQQFLLQSKLVSSTLTPNAALLKFAGSSNLTVDQVVRRRSEFLTTHGLNLVAIQPEPGVVALSVERSHRQVVRLQDLWRRWQPVCQAGNQELLIGIRESDGELLLLSPSAKHAPHTLIAGSTGSGKSVLMQNIILAIAATNTPEQARVILIDPKQGIDYFQFDNLPHLDGGLIDTQEQALIRLSSLVAEMDRRYVLFRQARTPNLEAYNRKMEPCQRLPYVWLVHDEFAEWMLIDEYKQAVTSSVSRLGVKARAAGIYLVFAAQRPDANVMPMQLRANLGNRLVLRVDSEGTSEIALGERGAERLLGKGHLLARLEGQTSVSFAQVPFSEISTTEEIVATIARGSATMASRD